MRHILTTFFDHDRKADVIPDTDWIDIRFKIFHEYTLKSMLNQTFGVPEIWVFCGQKFKEYTKSLPWDKRVRPIYDLGKERLEEIEDEWITVSRIDSDDLYHKSALFLINKRSMERRRKDVVTSFIFRRNLMWNQIYGFIGYHLRLCAPPPFVTRTYHKPIYKNWRRFLPTIIVSHGRKMREYLRPELLDDEWVFCIVKHGTNTNQLKRGVDPVMYTAQDIETAKRNGAIRTVDPDEIYEILKDYGVSRELSESMPQWIFRDGKMKLVSHTGVTEARGYVTNVECCE